jgi:hypothetical protein
MRRTDRLAIIVAIALSCGACAKPDSSSPTAPSLNNTASTSSITSTTQSSPETVSTAAVSCTIDIGTTTAPLPALHVLAGWINASLSQSSLTCGEVRSLAAKLQQEVAALDRDLQDRKFNVACGVSTGLLAELNALVSTGQLAVLTFPPPVPGAPTTVLGLAGLTNEMFCEAAHE